MGGDLLSNVYDEKVLSNFLDFCQNRLFTSDLKKTDMPSFVDDCKEMYEDKTKDRLKSLMGSELDKIKTINGVEVESIENLLDSIDWDKFYENAIPSFFHGDLQPENIIYDKSKDKFVLIDWRDSFGNSKEVGDVYYDLAKIYHALMINGNSVLQGKYDYKIKDDEAYVYFHAKSNLVYFKNLLRNFCEKNNYDWNSVKTLGVLQYLNICTLYDNFHDGKYGKFLFLFGKYMLTKTLKKDLTYV